MQLGFSSVTVFGFRHFAVKFPIISLVVIIRVIRNIISSMCSWWVKLSYFNIISIVNCEFFILIVFNIVRFRLRLGCLGSLMSLYGPTFHVTPVDLCIIFQCNLYISCIMSFGNKIVSNCFKPNHILRPIFINCLHNASKYIFETVISKVRYCHSDIKI